MITARRERRPTSVLVLLSALVLLAPASPASPGRQDIGQTPRYSGTFRIKGNWTPFNQVFDPALHSHYFITEQLYDGLVKFDSHFNPMPALAEYWTISDGGSRITFKLRRGVRFHNGRELTAEDVKYSFERLVKNRPGNTAYQYFTNKVVGAEDYWQGKAAAVTGFRVVDPSTFEIQWTRPFGSTGLYLLGMYYCKVLPKDLLESQGKSFFQKPVGTGPFKFAEWIRSPRLDILGVRLERNNTYFEERKPYLSAIEYSPDFTIDQFEEGSVHLVTVTSERLLRKRYPVLENGTLKSFFLALSCDIPPLDRPEVRKALALGLDKARLAGAYDTLSNIHQPLDNYIPPFLPGFFPRAAGTPSDPAAAKLLLDRLLGGSGSKGLTLALLFALPRSEATAGFARELGRQLATLGINLDVKYLRKPEDARGIRAPHLSFLEYNMDFPDPENIIAPLYSSRSNVNELNSRYSNTNLDGLLEQAEVEPSWERRAGLFREAEKILFQDTPAIPLFSERVRIAILPKVRGVRIPAMGFIFLDVKDIWLED
jgi:ABC-type transport system substrate-binding protein